MKDIHVFYDSSNITGCMQSTFAKNEPHVPWYLQRMHFANALDLIEHGRNAITKVLGGSLPPDNDALWEYARRKGYNTDLLHRIDLDNGRTAEQAVDEILHLKIANALLDYDPPQHLVVATGDGKMSEFGTGFRTQIERAIKRGWTAEVWAWESGLNAGYRALETSSDGAFQVRLLDPWYEQITFVKPGEFYPAPNTVAQLAGRVVKRLQF